MLLCHRNLPMGRNNSGRRNALKQIGGAEGCGATMASVCRSSGLLVSYLKMEVPRSSVRPCLCQRTRDRMCLCVASSSLRMAMPVLSIPSASALSAARAAANRCGVRPREVAPKQDREERSASAC